MMPSETASLGALAHTGHTSFRIPSERPQTAEDHAFFSGAALARLDAVLAHDRVPHALLRERLALRAAEACLIFGGRPERVAELRDAVHLMRPGDLPGPAGDLYLAWRRVVRRPVMAEDEGDPPCATATPVARAAMLLEAGLQDAPRDATPALLVAEAALARALGWARPVPLLATGLARGDLHARGADLRLACHRAVAVSAEEATRLAAELARKTARLTAVAPRLRAKGADGAVRMFLTRDAAAPSALPLPDRAARRLCDRLVSLGAVRELTGRDMFRLYGV